MIFGDRVNADCGEDALAVHQKHGVRVLSKDVLTDDLRLEPGSLDAVTSFDSMEHWHHSPKAAFHRLLAALKPGGLFFLGVPNCVNLRKRITVPLGAGKWSSMEEWYEREAFRGHVREPDVGDLRYIARDLGLRNVWIFGRNWLGYASRHGWVRGLTPLEAERHDGTPAKRRVVPGRGDRYRSKERERGRRARSARPRLALARSYCLESD